MNKIKNRSKLLTSEDYWAIWIGLFFLIFGVIVYILIGRNTIGEEVIKNHDIFIEQSHEAPFKTIAGYKAEDQKTLLTGANTQLGKGISNLLSKPKSWKEHPLTSFYKMEKEPASSNMAKVKELKDQLVTREQEALIAEEKARAALYKEVKLNEEATIAIQNWREVQADLKDVEKKVSFKGYNIFISLVLLGFILACIFGVG